MLGQCFDDLDSGAFCYISMPRNGECETFAFPYLVGALTNQTGRHAMLVSELSDLLLQVPLFLASDQSIVY